MSFAAKKSMRILSARLYSVAKIHWRGKYNTNAAGKDPSRERIVVSEAIHVMSCLFTERKWRVGK